MLIIKTNWNKGRQRKVSMLRKHNYRWLVHNRFSNRAPLKEPTRLIYAVSTFSVKRMSDASLTRAVGILRLHLGTSPPVVLSAHLESLCLFPTMF